MENMLGYIFGTLKTTETAVKDITASLRRQNGINRRNTMFAVAVTAWICVTEMRREKEREELEEKLQAQEARMNMLGAEIRSLKNEKGEAKM